MSLLEETGSVAEGFSGTLTVVTAIRWLVTKLQYKTKAVTYVNGAVTTIGTESAWTDVPTS